jgi:hypothetical protein
MRHVPAKRQFVEQSFAQGKAVFGVCLEREVRRPVYRSPGEILRAQSGIGIVDGKEAGISGMQERRGDVGQKAGNYPPGI